MLNGVNFQCADQDITSEELFQIDMLNLIDKLYGSTSDKKNISEFAQNKLEEHYTTFGFCWKPNNKDDAEGFIYFINRNLSNKNDFSQMFKLINHEIDHYFQMIINDTQEDKQSNKSQSDRIDQKSKDIINTKSFNKDKKFLYYLFERSQFNSRGTDCCNLLLQCICPKYKINSLKFFINKIKEISIAKNKDEIKTIQANFYNDLTNTKNQKINEIEQDDITAPLYFAGATLKLFPDTKWKVLLKRLEDDFKQYMDLSPQQQQKYAGQVAAHMKPHSKKAEQALKKMQEAPPAQQKQLQNAAKKNIATTRIT